ncbi:MAG: hypothetical protein EON51_02110 [Acinetobacter sp.]|nr:MAG: hypothetical protein EON51_02110 [Acinetobacter sp.]
MFKKIHSNRNPRDTIYSEIKKEYFVYFEKGGVFFLNVFAKYPKQIYVAMVALIIISLLLSFTIAGIEQQPIYDPKKNSVQEDARRDIANPINDGFVNIVETTSRLRETVKLKNEIEVMISKKVLTKSDSLCLKYALDRLQIINKPLNQKK